MNIFYFTSTKISEEIGSKIKIGDICIVNESNTLTIGIANSDLYKIPSDKYCLEAIYSKNVPLNIPFTNQIIFKYNGIHKRYGNINILETVMNVIDDKMINNFLRSCVSILEYNEERLSSSSIVNFYRKPFKELIIEIFPTSNQIMNQNTISPALKEKECFYHKEAITHTSKRTVKNCSVIHRPEEYYFFDFFDVKEQEEWTKLFQENMPLRNIYLMIKSNHKEIFRSALKNFNLKYPTLTIYSVKPKFCSETNLKETKRLSNEFDFIYKALVSKGFSQISNEIWEDKDKKRFRICIQPIEEI